MNRPSLGEIGYEAYRANSGGKSLVSGEAIPPFAQLPESIKTAWEAAGTAMSSEVGRQVEDFLHKQRNNL